MNEVPPDTVIVYQHGACEMRCAVFRLMILDDGTVIYHGMSYVRRWGVVLSNIQTGVVKELIGEAKAMDFFALKNGYGVGRDYDMSNDFQVSEEKCNSSSPDPPIACLQSQQEAFRKQ